MKKLLFTAFICLIFFAGCSFRDGCYQQSSCSSCQTYAPPVKYYYYGCCGYSDYHPVMTSCCD